MKVNVLVVEHGFCKNNLLRLIVPDLNRRSQDLVPLLHGKHRVPQPIHIQVTLNHHDTGNVLIDVIGIQLFHDP